MKKILMKKIIVRKPLMKKIIVKNKLSIMIITFEEVIFDNVFLSEQFWRK